MKKRVTVMGTSYEGLTIATGLASMGHKVTAFDANKDRVRLLQRSMVRDLEPELSKTMKTYIRGGELVFTSKPESSLSVSDAVFLSTASPVASLGKKASPPREVEYLTGSLDGYTVIMVMSAVPVGACRKLQEWFNQALSPGSVDVVFCPYTLRKGQGLQDFFKPEHIILGYEKELARRVVDEIYARLFMEEIPVFHVSWETAEKMCSVKRESPQESAAFQPSAC